MVDKRNRPVTPLQYRSQAAELRRQSTSFRSSVAKKRALLIAEELELLADINETGGGYSGDIH
jgi:hypothetical protein